ncbi:cytochrome c-type biogenesis protein [Brevirhabdus sp.]|uniref:cytochrome c-type biogenesis protein n=1 Tax=Brevirhabdus sp. TaxID=2004514 RepID=UPI0040580AF7
MRLIVLCLSLLLAFPAFAVQPDEVLADPVLEARARELSKGLRCLVCRNESIDESNADLARDLRLLVRERLVKGDSDKQAVAFIVDRYGEYVLLNPRNNGVNMLLWYAGPAALLIALLGAGLYLRSRRRADVADPSAPLSSDENHRLQEILEK